MVRKIMIGLLACAVIGAGLPGTQAAGTTWMKIYGDQESMGGAVLLADDGGFFIVGTTNVAFEPVQRSEVYLIRTDANGDVVWETTYGGDRYTSAQGMIQADDGSLLIAGVTTNPAGDTDAYVINVDQDGTELWSKTYGGPLAEMGGAVGPTGDGNYFLGGVVMDPNDPIADPGAAGYGGLAGRSSVYLSKIDRAGRELWSVVYDTGDNLLPNAALQTPDGGLLVLGTILDYPAPDDDLLLVKLDAAGQEVWSKVWTDDVIAGQAMIPTANGNYLIAASYLPLPDADTAKEDYLFIMVDAEGNERWRRTFGDPNLIDYGRVMVEAPDGGYVVAGDRTPDLYTWDADIAIIKIDAEGQLVWEHHTPVQHTIFSSMFLHPDGGYVIGGTTATDDGFRIFLIKTDADGVFER
jgi:serine-aspartate repeat-containing protein C/D/E